MNLGGSNRQLAVVAALIAVVVAAGVAVALGGDDPPPPAASAPTTAAPAPAPSATQPPAPPPTQPATVPKPGAERKAQRRQAKDARGIETAVTALIESAGEADAARFCPLVGLEPAGNGLPQVQRCAQKIDLDITTLPSSDELSFERVTVADGSGTARLSGGTRITLKKAGGKWQITRVRTASGGAVAP